MHSNRTPKRRNLGAQRHVKPTARGPRMLRTAAISRNGRCSDPVDTPGACCTGDRAVSIANAWNQAKEEQFRGSIEPGSTPSWEETGSGEREQALDRVERWICQRHKRCALAHWTARRGHWKTAITTRDGAKLTGAVQPANWFWRRQTSGSRGLRLMRSAAARVSTAFGGALAVVWHPAQIARRGDRSRTHIARRNRNKRQAGRQEQAARRTDPRGTTGESHEGDLQESRRVRSENRIIPLILEGFWAIVNGPLLSCLEAPYSPRRPRRQLSSLGRFSTSFCSSSRSC